MRRTRPCPLRGFWESKIRVSRIEDNAYPHEDAVSESAINNVFRPITHLVPKLLMISAQPTATRVSDKT